MRSDLTVWCFPCLVIVIHARKVFPIHSSSTREGKTFLAFMTMTLQGKHHTVRSSSQDCYNTVTCAGKGFVTPNKHDELPHSFYSTTDNNNYQQWPILVPYCGMDIRKFHFSLISGIFSVGGCWGQPMLFFSKLVDETQMSKPPKATRHHNSRKFLTLLPLRAI